MCVAALVGCGGRTAHDVAPPGSGARLAGGVESGGAGGPTGGSAAGAAGATVAPPSPFRTVDCRQGGATDESLSFDGRWLVYTASGSMCLLDRQSGQTRTLEASWDDAPVLSGNAERVAYGSGPGNTRTAYVWDAVTDAAVGSYHVGDQAMLALTRNGSELAFYTRDPGLTAVAPHYYGGIALVAIDGGVPELVSVDAQGASADDIASSPDISDDGQRVVFKSVATNLVPGKPSRRWDVYLRDRARPATVLVSATPTGRYPDGYSYGVHISGDGKTVLFDSMASDLVAGDTPGSKDLFWFDVERKTIGALTVGHSQGEYDVSLGNLSSEGRFVLFGARSGDFVPGDTNGVEDAFVYDRALGQYELVSRGWDGALLTSGGRPVAISGDGRVVVYATESPELVGTATGSVLCVAERG
jgi:hypothetical protein